MIVDPSKEREMKREIPLEQQPPQWYTDKLHLLQLTREKEEEKYKKKNKYQPTTIEYVGWRVRKWEKKH